MRLNTWLQAFRRAAVFGGNSLVLRRRKVLNDRIAQPAESFESRVLLTIDVDSPFGSPGEPVAQAAERFDSNATLDLVTLSATGQLTIALNGGDDAWSSIQTISLGLTSGYGLASGRVNSDPFADLAIQSADGITIALSDSAGGFSVSQTVTPAMAGQMAGNGGLPVGLMLGLLDEDFSTDLAVVVPGTNELLIYRGLSNGLFGSPIRYASGGTEPVSVVTGQFVGSTAPDLAVAHSNGTITFFAGDGAGAFTQHSSQILTGANGTSPAVIKSLGVSDLNGDGESDLVVAATDTAVVLLNQTDTLLSSPIVNGRFDQGLTGWTTQVVGHSANQRPGMISGINGFAQFTENESFLTSLQQSFVVPNVPQTLSFDLRSLGLELSALGIPDAFEVSLLNSANNSLLPTHRAEATSFFNVTAGAQASLASGVTSNGTTVTVNISDLVPGSNATLMFDLVGNPPGTSSTVVLDNVVITPDRITRDVFTIVTLPGAFQDATGVAVGDVNGDDLPDILATDRTADMLLVFHGSGTGTFLRTDISLTAFGTGPVSVVAADLMTGSTEDDITVGLYTSSLVVSGLDVDTVAPTATLISPIPDAINTGVSNQMVIEFSEPVRDNGSGGNNSVTSLNAWRLAEAGTDGVFGTTDDVQVPLQSVAWSSTTRRATLTIGEAVLADGLYRLSLEGTNTESAITDLSGNRLNNGPGEFFGFQVNTGTGNTSRFFVVDSRSDKTFRYGSTGASQGNFRLRSHNRNVRGVTTTSAGNPTWTIDRNIRVYVYDSVTGESLGSWKASGLHRPEDIATDGTDIWVIDRRDDRIYRYADAASRRNGSQPAADSFRLHSGNRNPTGLATDGVLLWAVDKNAASVFIYNVADGAYLGTWTIDRRNDRPTGITIDPGGGNDIWNVDRRDKAVYRYADARSRLSGSQASADSFALSSGNRRPQGIVDPVFGYTLNTVISSGISVPGEVDEYQFAATAGQRLFLDVQLVQSGVAHVFLKNPDGSTIIGYGNGPGAGNPDEEDGNFLLTQTGTYTMRVESLTGDTPAYQVATYDVTTPDQSTITVGIPASGAIDLPGGTDEWTIDVTAGQNLWFQALSVTGATFVKSTLYSPSGAVVFNELSPDFGPASFTESGSYRLIMDGLRDDTPSYRFIVRDTTPVVRNIQIGDTGVSTIAAAQSKDIWRFSATSGQSVYVDFQLATDNGVQYQLVAPNGSVYASAGNFVLSQLDQGPVLLDQSGLWELRVSGPGLTTPGYRFKLWGVPAPDVYTVSPGELFLGNIESPGRQDVFEWQGYAGQQLYIDFQQNGAWLDWEFRQPDGTLIQTASAFLITQLDGGPLTLSSDGIYQLTVRGHGDAVGDFQLRLFDITPSAPTPIVLDQIVTGSLNRPGQTPAYSFNGTVGTALQLDVLFNEDNLLAWKLVTPSGSTLFVDAAFSQTVPSLPESGTYLLSLDQLNGARTDTTGQFSFRLIDPTVTPPLPVPADLVVASIERPSLAIGTSVSFDVTWTTGVLSVI